jgi:hypothetical protein
VAESCTIYSSRSRRPVRKLLDTPSIVLSTEAFRLHAPLINSFCHSEDKTPITSSQFSILIIFYQTNSDIFSSFILYTCSNHLPIISSNEYALIIYVPGQYRQDGYELDLTITATGLTSTHKLDNLGPVSNYMEQYFCSSSASQDIPHLL